MAFGRVVEIIIGPEGEEGVKITQDMKIWFEVTKTGLKTINSAQVKIWNLSDSTAEKLSRAKQAFIIRAGYADEGGAKSIFYGKVMHSLFSKEPPNKILTLQGTDGYIVSRERYAVLSYTEGTNNSTILKDVLDLVGLPVGNKYTLPSLEYAGGLSFIGKATDALTLVLNRVGLNWSIQNEQIYILANGEGFEVQALLLNYESGLITAPEKLTDIVHEIKTGIPPTRYKIKSLLYAQIIPGALLKLDVPEARGTFVVETATISGDSMDGEFVVDAVVREKK